MTNRTVCIHSPEQQWDSSKTMIQNIENLYLTPTVTPDIIIEDTIVCRILHGYSTGIGEGSSDVDFVIPYNLHWIDYGKSEQHEQSGWHKIDRKQNRS